jgi:hypothetical protein
MNTTKVNDFYKGLACASAGCAYAMLRGGELGSHLAGFLVARAVPRRSSLL